MAKKRSLAHSSVTRALPFLGRLARFLVKSQLLTVLLLLCALGYWAGSRARPDAGKVPYEELFENMRVLSYRDTPSDTLPHFVVELGARGRVFRQLEVDARRFSEPIRGRDYRRSISGSRYDPWRVRGHVARGFWFELPSSPSRPAHADQFDELYRSTLDYLKPVSITAAVLGALSGYSTGYRMAIWGGSLANPKVQERVLATPGIDREIAREAWRRVLLEPVVVGHEADAGRFAEIRGTQRVYANFFRLALNDSDRFIPREIARLDSMGRHREARAMRSFADAVFHASTDSCALTSADFLAVEEWASLLQKDGHWAGEAIPAGGEERMRYLGTLAWYGIAPTSGTERRIWVGPRILVRTGDAEGFVADEIPIHDTGCPLAWREWLRDDSMTLSANAWTAQWMGDLKQFTPLVQAGRDLARAMGGGSRQTRPPHDVRVAAVGTNAVVPTTAPSTRPSVSSYYQIGRSAFLVPSPSPTSTPATVPDSLLPGVELTAPPHDSTGAGDSTDTALDLPPVGGEAVGVAAEP